MPPDLIQDALALYGLTEDPLLLDSVRILSLRNQHEELTTMATNNILACKQAYLTLYGGSDKHPLHGKLAITDDT